MLAERIAERLHLRFPTVPEAVADFVRASGKSALMPLGTLGIMETYAEAIRRSGSPLQLVAPDRRQQAMVLEAIKAALCDDEGQQQAAERALADIAAQVARQYGPQVAIVQACTDLSFDLALDSNAIYAETVVASVYGPSDRPVPE
jgi:aspartate/glutamate racemase